MKILLISATAFEIAPLRERLGQPVADGRVTLGKLQIGFLETGIGMVNTAFVLGQMVAIERPDLALQVGIAGAFPGGPNLGEVIEVVKEIYPELGADSPEGYLGLAQMGFPHFRHGGHIYYNVIDQPRPGLSQFAHCTSVTVNRVSGEADAIRVLQNRWQPQVESMEGAAFFQACLLAGVPFRQLRAISNCVEPRDRSKWRLPEAVASLNQTVWELLSQASIDPSVL